MHHAPHFLLSISLLLLIGTLGTGCELLGVAPPEMFDSAISDMKPEADRVNLLTPTSKLVSLSPKRLKQKVGVKGSLVALAVESTTPRMRVVSNGVGSFTIGQSKKVVVYGTYYPRLTCLGNCAPQNWTARVQKDLNGYILRGDQFNILKQHATANEAWVVMHKTSGVSGINIVRYWRWKDNTEAAYLCTAELADKRFHNYADFFLEACKVATATFE